jgi:hypothetical protein
VENPFRFSGFANVEVPLTKHPVFPTSKGTRKVNKGLKKH